MKKSTRITMPRRAVLPLAAATLLGACDDRTPGSFSMTNIVPNKSGGSAAERLRAQRERDLDLDDEVTPASGKMHRAPRTNARLHHV